MKDALQLINRHGGKIWLFASLGEGFLSVLWAVGLIAVWLIVTPSPEMIHKVVAAVYFPDHPERMLDQIRAEILEAPLKMKLLLSTLALFFAGSVLFSVTGMMGLIRQAAVKDRLSFGDFFSFGFRYLIQVFVLTLILAGAVLSLGWLFLRLDSLVESRIAYRAALWGMGGLVGLYGLAYFSFAPMVMLVERTGIFQTLGRVFRLLWKRPARTVFTLFSALISAVLGVVLLRIHLRFSVADPADVSKRNHRGDGGGFLRSLDDLHLSRVSRNALLGDHDPCLCGDEGEAVPRGNGRRNASPLQPGDLEQGVKVL